MQEFDKTSFFEQIATRKRTMFAFFGMWLPNPDPVLRKMGRTIQIYDEVATHPYVRGAIKNRRAGVTSLNWCIDRGKTPSRQAKVIEDLFNSLDMQRIISEIHQATQYGYQPLEIMWKQTGNLILPQDIIGKPPYWFHFNFENELLLRTITNPLGDILPDKKFLLARQEATYDNPYGYADLSSCFWPVTFIKGGMTFWLRFIEKWGMAKIIGKHPRGADPKEVQKLSDNLEAMVQDAIATIPDDCSVEPFEDQQKTASSEAYKDLVAECKNEISVVQLGHEGGFQSTPGKLGGENVSTEVRQAIIMADKKIIESVFNEQLIPWIMDLNFGSSVDRPVFSMYAEEDVDKTLAERDQLLARDCGVKFKPVYFTRAYGLKEDEFDVSEPVVVPPVPGDAGQQGAFAEGPGDHAANAGLDQVDKMVDRLTNEVTQDEYLSQVNKLMGECNTLEELRDRIIDLYPTMKPAQMGNALAMAMAEAEMAGRYELLKDIGKAK